MQTSIRRYSPQRLGNLFARPVLVVIVKSLRLGPQKVVNWKIPDTYGPKHGTMDQCSQRHQ